MESEFGAQVQGLASPPSQQGAVPWVLDKRVL